ncbi:3D domain-containing protein [Shigella flexneri]
MPLVGRASVYFPNRRLFQVLPCWQKCRCWIMTGKFNGRYELRLMVALDVGGANQRPTLRYLSRDRARTRRAGWYNHYGRVWVLKHPAQVTSSRLM